MTSTPRRSLLGRMVTGLGLIALGHVTAQAASISPTADCAALAALSFGSDTGITVAQYYAAGTYASPVGTVSKPMCRVAGLVLPAINFEVWMPADGSWNGRFLGIGGGGLSGSISYSALTSGVNSGYATGSTDTGHVSTDTAWFTNYQQMADNGHRGVHEMTAKSKAIVNAYFGQGPNYSYFNGCSSGGGQAVMEAWRYPKDYNGILAGDPNLRPTRNRAGSHIYVWWRMHKDDALTDRSLISSAQIAAINSAALSACDGLDGVTDGVIEDPRVCKFDPSVLSCSVNSASTCLSDKQLAAVKDLYRGPKFDDGSEIYQGYPFGSEAGWGVRISGTTPTQAGYDYFRYAVLQDSSFDFRNFQLDTHTKLADNLHASLLNVGSADLRPFATAGGKLLMYHGWSDQQITAYNTTDFYDSMVDYYSTRRHSSSTSGASTLDSTALSKVRSFARLFMVPGMQHCGGGSGTDTFDGMTPLIDWVEKGTAPTTITATHKTSGVVDKTRPLCMYPQVAVYDGKGSTSSLSSFTCKDPATYGRGHGYGLP